MVAETILVRGDEELSLTFFFSFIANDFECSFVCMKGKKKKRFFMDLVILKRLKMVLN